jgi:periplasmic divalent cation tolerance protein
MTPYRIVFITSGNEEEAARVAKGLVEERLAACVNIINPIRSIYRWEGKVCDEKELLLVAKTHVARLSSLIERVKSLHGYDVPEVLAVPVEAGFRPYLEWVDECCETEG